MARARYGWLAVLALAGVLSGCLPEVQERIKGHFLMDVAGVPFLVPYDYATIQKGQEGPQREIFLRASLPEVGRDGKQAAREKMTGTPRLLQIRMFPPESELTLDPGALIPEQVVKNHITLFQEKRGGMQGPARDIDFKARWDDFAAAHKDADGELVDATALLGWDTKGTPASAFHKRVFVAFSKGRVVAFANCDTPRPGTFPGCWTYYQGPEDRFAFNFTYAIEHQDRTVDIARKVTALMNSFNEAAIRHRELAKAE
ncbi:MAG: hypothetical protein HQL35_15160 [Alphaproteobacteria bacterium]|nr:hypothetical protein [Alphaproteobacteria bacterium]